VDRKELAEQIYQTSHITGDFLLRSGTRSHQYFDKYLFESQPELLNEIARHMVALVPEGSQRLAGLEMGGIPLATALSMQTGLPAMFVRKKAKEYGTCKLAEGTYNSGDSIAIVEDVVTSGGQAIISANELRDLGFNVTSILCVIDRESGGGENIVEAGFDFAPLFRMSELTP
jgi:orotate phosphoribosyltransferase